MHSHNHSHSREKNIKTAVFLNVGFTIIEIVGGLLTNSLAILSDALHDFGDSVVLISSWILERKSNAPADKKRTFGYARLSLFSAFLSATILIIGSVFILVKAIPRLFNPEAVNAPGMILIAVLGITFNGIAFLRMKKGSSMNERVLSWHLLEDVLGWIVIFVGSIVIYFWNVPILDPIMTIGFSAFVLWSVAKNFKEAFNIFLQGVPEQINIDKIKEDLLLIEGVKNAHDMHVWSLDGEKNVFTGHVVVEDEALKTPDTIIRKIKETVEKSNIEHSTIELESKSTCSGIDCEHGHEH